MRNKAELCVSGLLDTSWQYETTRLDVSRIYIPDFYHPATGTLLEVKGQADPWDRTKFIAASNAVNSRRVTITGYLPPVLENAIRLVIEEYGHVPVIKQQPYITRFIAAPFVPDYLALCHKQNTVYNAPTSGNILSGASLCSWLQASNVEFTPFSLKYHEALRDKLEQITKKNLLDKL